jgi:hypothetical protein
MKIENEMTDYGWANGYNPELDAAFEKCVAMKHKLSRLWVSPSGNTQTECCKECGYKFTVDMS